MKINRGLQSSDLIQSNPWMDPIHVQLWGNISRYKLQ